MNWDCDPGYIACVFKALCMCSDRSFIHMSWSTVYGEARHCLGRSCIISDLGLLPGSLTFSEAFLWPFLRCGILTYCCFLRRVWGFVINCAAYG